MGRHVERTIQAWFASKVPNAVGMIEVEPGEMRELANRISATAPEEEWYGSLEQGAAVADGGEPEAVPGTPA